MFFLIVFVFYRNEEILSLWSTARFGNNVFLGGNDSSPSLAGFDTYIDQPSSLTDKERMDRIYDTVFDDWW